MLFHTGNLVVYRGRGAIVSAVGAEKIEIRTESGDVKSVRPKDIELLHAGPVAQLPPTVLPEPDYEELLALMEAETLSFRDFQELAYGESSPAAAWSARLLLEAGIYFTGSVRDGVRARSGEEVAASLAARAARVEEAQRRAALLERIRSGVLEEGDRSAMREVELLALGRSASSRLMRDLGQEAIPEKAHQLLLKTGIWDDFVDPWPSRSGVEIEEPAGVLPPLPEEVRRDLTGRAALVIDDAGSQDPDDAIDFADGLIWVHVADPAALVASDSELDREARRRGANLYLPEGVHHMLPPEATERLGLGLAETSPALSLAIRIADNGESVLEDMTLSRIRGVRLDYEGAEPLLTQSPLRELAVELERFRRFRAERGALFIHLPEVKITVQEHQVRMKPLPLSPVRELVANAMLAAGAAVAKWAEEREIPMPYVVQPPPEERPDSTTLPGMFALRRSCAPSVTGILPGLHAGLGLQPYVRVTSPLRRYCDLLAHQQLRRYLAGETCWSSDEMDARIAVAENAAAERRRLERQVNEFWTLVYLRHCGQKTFDAVPVFRQDDRITYLIPELAYEFKNRFGGDIRLGEPVVAEVAAVDPVTLSARFLIR